MRLKSIINIFREILYLKSVMKMYGNMLLPGKYCLLDGFRAMALNSPEVLNSAHAYFDKPGINSKMASIARSLNKIGYYTNKRKNSVGHYEAFYTANNYDKFREVKLFSFTENKILTICTSEAEANKQISQYETLSSAYPLPCIKRNEKLPAAFEISMVKLSLIPREYDAIENIANSTMCFNQNPTLLNRYLVSELISFSYENEEIDSLLNSLVAKIPQELLNIQLPLCLQHGDLSKDNLLYGESDGKVGFWWIDWEHLSERIFFYDLFFYIINSAIYYDENALNDYMAGVLDPILSVFFNHFGITFMAKYRLGYLLIFAIIFLKERVCSFNRTAALEKYCRFLHSICN